MSSAQIVSATAIHSRLGLAGLPRPTLPGATGVRDRFKTFSVPCIGIVLHYNNAIHFTPFLDLAIVNRAAWFLSRVSVYNLTNLNTVYMTD